MRRIIMVVFCFLFTGQVFAWDFTDVCSTGQTLYYSITSNTEPYTVEVTNPFWGGSGLRKPTGDIIIPETVVCDGKTYVVKSIGYKT